MKKHKVAAVVGIMAVLCVVLAGCYLPGDPVVDPIVDPIEPPATLPVAAFSFYPLVPEYPVQTGSQIRFDGLASYDPDGEIMWGRWDFGELPESTIVEGRWVNMVKGIENGEEVWKAISVMREEFHSYDDVGYYDVRLTVWDYDGNQDSITRRVRVWSDD